MNVELEKNSRRGHYRPVTPIETKQIGTYVELPSPPSSLYPISYKLGRQPPSYNVRREERYISTKVLPKKENVYYRYLAVTSTGEIRNRVGDY